MSLATVAEEQEKTRGPVPADHSSEGNLRQKTAWAHEADRARNLARQSGKPYDDEKPAPLSPEIEARQIVHDLGLSNQAESHRFINRILALEKDNKVLGLLITQLQSEASALKDRVTQLERKRGLPRGAETRIDCGETR
jgi:hypothetical protein